MKGYNPERIARPEIRKTKAKVLTVLNNVGRWVRVSSKSLDFYAENRGVVESKEITEHRTEYYNADGRCVMVYEH